MRNRLTENNSCGNWWLKGVKWQQLYTGQTITKEVQEKLYGALFKLMEYEESGLTPDEVQELAKKKIEETRRTRNGRKNLQDL